MTWVALLRGINVGRNKRLAMADLRRILESLGFENVRTHLQSGNAIFSTERTGAAKLERQIADALREDAGLDVRVLCRTAAELDAVVQANPFAGKGDPKELHAVFVSATPATKRLAEVGPEQFAPNEFVAGDRVIYMRLPKGVMGGPLPDWDRALALDATMRSWGTVSRLHDLASRGAG